MVSWSSFHEGNVVNGLGQHPGAVGDKTVVNM